MSIFPKRTLRDTTVTIHWNFNTSALRGKHICPFVRIGVEDPTGKLTMLFEQHVLALPGLDHLPASEATARPVYLNKNTPLLLLASYLSGRQSRQKLVDILENIQAGRHFYFSYKVPADAPLGKYRLLSEVISDGEVRYSKTADDDYFFVEKVSVKRDSDGLVKLVNQSPEPTPVKMVYYHPGVALEAKDVEAFELAGFEERQVDLRSPAPFLSYSEEREQIPIAVSESTIIRNPYFATLQKADDDKLYLMHVEKEEGYVLEGPNLQVWHAANGITPVSALLAIDEEQYGEMLNHGLINELRDFIPLRRKPEVQ